MLAWPILAFTVWYDARNLSLSYFSAFSLTSGFCAELRAIAAPANKRGFVQSKSRIHGLTYVSREYF